MKACSGRFFFLWLFILPVFTAYGKTEMLDGDNGLSSSVVTDVVKDRRGLMWIGTHNGLNSYNGYVFARPYPELADLAISRLVYDRQKNVIWVGTRKGLYAVNPDNGRVHQVGGDTGWVRNHVTALVPMPDSGGVYVSYQGGEIVEVNSQYRLRLITKLSAEAGNTTFFVRSMCNAAEGGLFFCTFQSRGYVSHLDVATGRIREIRINKDYGVIWLKNYGDTVLVGTGEHGVQMLYKSLSRYITPPVVKSLNAGKRGSAAILYKGKLLLHYTGGILLSYDPESGSLTGIGEKYPESERIGYNSLCVDEDGIFWAGTDRGLCKISNEHHVFGKALAHFPGATMRAMVESTNGDIYAGSHSGLYHYDVLHDKWTHYPYLDPERKIPARLFDLMDDGAYVYAACSDILPLCRFNKHTRTFERGFYNESVLRNIPRSFALHKDTRGRIWTGSSNGLVLYDSLNHKLELQIRGRFNIGDCIVREIKGASNKNAFWVATDKGVMLVDEEQGVVLHLNKDTEPALSVNEIFTLYEDSAGSLWIGTNGGGVNIVSSDRKSVRYLSKQDGLSNDIVYGMLQDHHGRVWISTSNGLSCYQPEKNTFSNFYVTDGLIHNEFNQRSFLKTRGDKMYFGGVKGLHVFSPDSVMASQMTNHVSLFISPVSRWNSETNTFSTMSDIAGKGELIELSSPNESLVLNLGLTDYTDPMHNSFSYRVKGLLDEWMPLQLPPVLRLGGIPYGKYTVEVRAMNARGVHAANGLHFDLLINPPFYKTWWFYVLLFMLIVSLIYAFFHMRYRNLKSLQQLRVQIASDLHDEVGGMLTRITIFSDSVRGDDNTEPVKTEKLEKIATLSREATSSMSDILWTIDARNDYSGTLAERMRGYMEDMLLPAGIELTFDISPSSQKSHRLPAKVRQQLYMIFKEAVHNMLKHANATKAKLTYHYDSSRFLLRIENDGADQPAASSLSGQGLKNMEMRAQKIGAHVSVTSSNGSFIIAIENRS